MDNKDRMEKISLVNAQITAAHDSVERDYQALINKLNGKEHSLRERLDEINKKRFHPDRANPDARGDDHVEINAGGRIIAARRSVLTQVEGTRFEALFSGRWDGELQRDGHGRIFVDVNSVCFQAIVDYLNELAITTGDNPLSPPVVDDEYKAILRRQLELFGLWDAVWSLDSKIIRDDGEADQLHSWLEEDHADGELRLLYRSSRDGLSGVSFHYKCDDQGCTLTIFETVDGYVLGGYSNTPWANSGGQRRADRAFLFVLSGGDVASPLKMKLKDAHDRRAVYHFPSRGPLFGGGYDLKVNGSDVHLNFGNSFEPGPSGQLARRDGGGYAIFAIKEMEVFQVTGDCSPAAGSAAKARAQGEVPAFEAVTRFSEDVNDAINAKQESLLQSEAGILHLEESFEDERNFIASFSSGETNDVITLSVSGTIMASKRSTLQAIEDSVLAQRFDDTKWTEQGPKNARCVKKWAPEDVVSWAKTIEDVPPDIAEIFEENEISGRELIALNMEGLKMLGVSRPGTLCLLLDEIKILRQASRDVATLVEHGPYCFGKILDYLRLKQIHSRGLSEEPALPQVCDSQRSRFEKVVRYYFPGDSAKLILG